MAWARPPIYLPTHQQRLRSVRKSFECDSPLKLALPKEVGWRELPSRQPPDLQGATQLMEADRRKANLPHN